ncbi:prolyl 4-hydroxylase subunit alpha-1-like [Condylostylus longicornis]|uniref:prolyl 4-hydroxylase subunit alpha-1-like n=1 Tax=Condylostylus longicornis TaxID=2530218 RepID=UPI00244DADFE|nr:prolyl 4-hydroxylase subunit alpha-1-like [Condylostylus longicornis]
MENKSTEREPKLKEAIENYRQQSSDNSLILPTEHDLKGVTLGLLRVQEVYSVSAEQMANGVINGIKFNSTFSAADCFEVARVLAKENYHYYAIEWYKMALERFDEEGWRGIQPAIKKNLIVSNLGHSLYAEGGAQNLATAIEIISKTLKENSHENDLELTKNLKEYVDHFTALTSNISTVSEKIFPQGALNVYSFEEMNILRKGCTGQLKKSPSEERKLFCKYEKNNHPFLMLAPLKLEILNFSPYLVIFHEVLYDSEIEMLKELSADRLVRAKVWNPSEGRAEVSNVRTGKYLWIYDDEYPLMSVLNQRLNDMTGMTMETSEAFQMMNYGIGGHYDLHSDDLNEPSEENDFQPFSYYEWGNRISTVLFYLSDVQYGGGTIWPKINVIAYPRKGTAAFWYNLRHDGQPDFKSQHAACPVILGSKWVCVCCCLQEGDDLHSSITALNAIFNVEKLLIKSLANYITDSERNINSLRKSINEFGQRRQNNSDQINNELHVHSFLNLLMLKRKLSRNITSFENNRKFTATDLEGATLGVLRIQEIYDIPPADIANGVINGIDFGTKFTAFDCLMMALKLRAMNFHHYAIQWLENALKRVEEEGWRGIIPEQDKNVIIDLLLNTKYEEGSLRNIEDAIKISLTTLRENFSHSDALHFAKNLLIFVQQYIHLKSRNESPVSLKPPRGTIFQGNLLEYNLLKKGCKGELKKSPAEQRKLFCKYERENHPFLKLAPIKTEIMNLRPYLTVSYDVLYDSEIEILKNLSSEKLVRASVWNQYNGTGVRSAVRTSKLTWLSNDTHPVIHTLNQRVSDISGLSIEYSENFQLMNYGIGGHYDLHPDYFPDPEESVRISQGNRIATVLFYMSDVAEGGGTTWPNIQVTTSAKKGSAAFWYNLYADGAPDYLARHSACPIILGSKWVINKWIRIRGQEFRRPCLTYRDHLTGSKE